MFKSPPDPCNTIMAWDYLSHSSIPRGLCVRLVGDVLVPRAARRRGLARTRRHLWRHGQQERTGIKHGLAIDLGLTCLDVD